MAINTNVYGDSTDWYYPPALSSFHTFFDNNYALLNAFKATPPKSANFGGTVDNDRGCLGRGISENKTPQNEAIDSSIVAIGQDPAVSPFGKIKCVKVQSRSSWYPTRGVTTIENTTSINTFFSTWQGTSSYYDNMNAWKTDVDGSPNSIWLPDSNITNNPNVRVFPIVSYGAKSMLLTPVVFTSTSEIGGAQNGTWRTLNSWRDNYSSEYVYGIAMRVQIVSAISANTITYANTGLTAMTQRITSALYDPINDNDGNFIDYCFTYDTITARGDLIVLMKYGGYSAHVTQDQVTNHTHVYFPNVELFDNCELKESWDMNISAIETIRWGYRFTYSENNYNIIMKWAALFGVPFTPTGTTSFSTTFDDENLYFPVIDDNGITHGDYTHGAANLTNPFNNIGNVHEYNYDPVGPVDPNTYSNITGFNSISGGASMTKRYVLDKANVDKLADDLWTISSELAQVQGSQDYDHFEAKVIDNFLVTNPIDCIVSLKRFPFDVPHTFSSAKELVKLGKNTASAQGYATYNVFNTVHFAGVNIYKRFGGCFLDYEPYTQYELYVPFCGTTNLQAADIVGHTLNVRLQIDLLTGTCTAYIMADSLCIETLTGNCSCDLQITGTDTTYMNSAIVNSVTTAATAKSQLTTAKYGFISPAGILGNISNPWKAKTNTITAEQNMYKADYDLQHLQTPIHSMGTASALTGWYQEFNARLMIYYPEGDAIISTVPPKLADLTNYGHTTGFATVENKTLSNYSGLTVCSDIDLSGITQATATEKQMIYNALTGGVYI